MFMQFCFEFIYAEGGFKFAGHGIEDVSDLVHIGISCKAIRVLVNAALDRLFRAALGVDHVTVCEMCQPPAMVPKRQRTEAQGVIGIWTFRHRCLLD